MSDARHPDDEQRLRAALWGDAEVERHAAACAACAHDLVYHRSVREAYRRWRHAEPPLAAMVLARDAVGADPDFPRDARWFPAAPAGFLVGARAAAGADLHVVCDAD